jgi:hypothetical protein
MNRASAVKKGILPMPALDTPDPGPLTVNLFPVTPEACA